MGGFCKSRVSAKTKGLKKVPGQSWIEVKKKVYVFPACNTCEIGMENVYNILRHLGLHMEIEGYLPDKRFVPQDVGEDINWD